LFSRWSLLAELAAAAKVPARRHRGEGRGGAPPRHSPFRSISLNSIARRPVSRVLSPPLRAMDDHSSGTSVAGRLARPTRAAARKHARPVPPEKAGLPPLRGLAPGGVCPARSVAGPAVRSYRTLSPLPANALRRPAVCSLWHFPWGRPRRALPGTVFPWSPDFPPPKNSKEFPGGRPSGRLAGLR